MGKSFSAFIMAIGMAGAALTDVAQAGAPLSVMVDRSEYMALSGEPGTIIVGNPAIADVSLNGKQLFIHGRSAGETNLIVFDQSGNKLAEYDVSVGQDSTNGLTMFAGTSTGVSRLSYVCNGNCERTMIVGDNNTALSTLINNNQAKMGLAQGTKGGGAGGGGGGSGGAVQ